MTDANTADTNYTDITYRQADWRHRMNDDPMVPNKDKLYRTGPLNMDQVGELETLLREKALVEVTPRSAQAWVNAEFNERVDASQPSDSEPTDEGGQEGDEER